MPCCLKPRLRIRLSLPHEALFSGQEQESACVETSGQLRPGVNTAPRLVQCAAGNELK